MKKLFLLTLTLVFAFNAVAFAAVSSSKPKFSAPAPTPPTKQTSPSQPPGYKPSSPASSYSEKAPPAQQPVPNTAQQPASGGFMRNLGLFGGGMLLGSLLGGMFGFGHSGLLATVMGVLINILLLAAIFIAGRYLWNKFKNKTNEKKY